LFRPGRAGCELGGNGSTNGLKMALLAWLGTVLHRFQQTTQNIDFHFFKLQSNIAEFKIITP
jgi:hypothetical protein